MFERFTKQARRVIEVSQQLAQGLGHDYLGTEHILLGLVQERDGGGATVLRSLGVSLDGVRGAVEETVGAGTRSPDGHVPFTPQAKEVLQLSLRESLQLGHNYIGTEHILLGLIGEDEGVAAQVLAKAGVDLDAARNRVVRLVGRSNPEGTDLDLTGQADRRMHDEVKRLRALLHRHGIDPDDNNTA
jgi:ATP-dependent Clp protease ATP-binding subunit ClpC